LQGDQSAAFVDLVKASTFGIQLYQIVCPRYLKRPEPVDILDGPEGRFGSQELALKHQLKAMIYDVPGKDVPWLRFT
jgi:hypothetical protein